MIQRIPSIAKFAAAAAVAALLNACAHTDRATPIAEATINPTEGNNIGGYFRVYRESTATRCA